MAKLFNFWQTVSKKAKWQPWYRKCTARGINFSFWYSFCYPSRSERDNDREGRCSLDGALFNNTFWLYENRNCGKTVIIWRKNTYFCNYYNKISLKSNKTLKGSLNWVHRWINKWCRETGYHCTFVECAELTLWSVATSRKWCVKTLIKPLHLSSNF